tara:strand:- start:27165 stop:27584 length:420 start_codon:yes stop_codon:yes gene_type:complete
MSTLKKAIIDYLLTQTAVTDLVGTRIRPGVIEQGLARPHLRVDQTGSDVHYAMSGNTGLGETFIEIVCEADSEKDAADLADVVRKEVDGFSGTWGSVSVKASFWRGTRDTRTAPLSGGEIGLPSQTIAVEVFHEIAVPS